MSNFGDLTVCGIFIHMKEALVYKEKEKVSRFTDLQKVQIAALGYSIFELHGESVNSLKGKGMSFWSRWHEDKDFEMKVGRLGDVAINTKNLFLPHSGGRSIFEQLKIVNNFNNEINQKIPGVRAVIGTAFDYIDLEFQYQKTTGVWLFRRHENNYNAITTSMKDGWPLFVGESYSESVYISYRLRHSDSDDIRVAPLIIPLN